VVRVVCDLAVVVLREAGSAAIVKALPLNWAGLGFDLVSLGQQSVKYSLVLGLIGRVNVQLHAKAPVTCERIAEVTVLASLMRYGIDNNPTCAVGGRLFGRPFVSLAQVFQHLAEKVDISLFPVTDAAEHRPAFRQVYVRCLPPGGQPLLRLSMANSIIAQ